MLSLTLFSRHVRVLVLVLMLVYGIALLTFAALPKF